MKLTLETAKQENLPIEAWWPHKGEPWPNFLGQLYMCRLSLPGCLPRYEINEFPVTWLIVLLAVWLCDRASCTSQQTESRTLPTRASKPAHPATPPAEICTQTRGGWRASTFSWNTFSARRGATGKGSCCWTRPLLTHRSWQGYRWPTSPSVQHHQRRGNAKYIFPITSWNLTQKHNILHSYA